MSAALTLTGCTSTTEPPAPSLPNPNVPLGPEVPEFYLAPSPLPDAQPGDLVWARPLDAPDEVRGYAVLYWSTATDGSLVAVSGVVFEPSEPSRRTGPVFAWAHGPFGLGDPCAPSQGFFSGEGPSLPVVMRAVAEGAVFVATDYQGLGTPDEHPYLVNQAAGRDLLDAVRAASRFTGAAPRAVIVGHSQGASAALLAAELQPEYAPDVELLGTAAVSTPSATSLLGGQLSAGPYFGYVLMTVYGYRSAYPELSADAAALTEEGRTALQTISTQCLREILRRYAHRDAAEFGLAGVIEDTAFQRRLAENEPGHQSPDTPLLLVHGTLDDIIPAGEVRELADRYCATGVPVTVREYPDHGHVDVLVAALDDIVSFLGDRFAGEPVTGAWTC